MPQDVFLLRATIGEALIHRWFFKIQKLFQKQSEKGPTSCLREAGLSYLPCIGSTTVLSPLIFSRWFLPDGTKRKTVKRQMVSVSLEKVWTE